VEGESMNTQLAETIARVKAAEPDWTRAVWASDMLVLLACARRCEAIDAGGFDHDMFTDLLRRDDNGKAELGPQYIRKLGAIVDAAAESLSLRSERDALAKRVEELGRELHQKSVLLDHESSGWAECSAELCRVRDENKRLDAEVNRIVSYFKLKHRNVDKQRRRLLAERLEQQAEQLEINASWCREMSLCHGGQTKADLLTVASDDTARASKLRAIAARLTSPSQ
jgi:hypothetical protein